MDETDCDQNDEIITISNETIELMNQIDGDVFNVSSMVDDEFCSCVLKFHHHQDDDDEWEKSSRGKYARDSLSSTEPKRSTNSRKHKHKHHHHHRRHHRHHSDRDKKRRHTKHRHDELSNESFGDEYRHSPTQIITSPNELNDISTSPLTIDKCEMSNSPSEIKNTSAGIETAANEHEQTSLSTDTYSKTNNDQSVNQTEENYEELKTKFRMQLELRLFDKPLGECKQESNIDKANGHEKEKGDQVEDHQKNKNHKNHHKHKKHKSNPKSKSKIARLEDDNDNDILRRSDRIKTIETQKLHHKELKIAEKLKKHKTDAVNLNETASNDAFDKSDQESETDAADLEKHSNPNGNEKQPIKIKERWRRCSEKENESVLTTGQTCSQDTAKSESNDESNSKHISSSKPVNDTNETTDKLPLNFEIIDKNSYVSKRIKSNKESKRMTCDCTTSHQERSMGIAACGSDCLNRMLLIECGKRCPCGEFCTNRNFKNKNNAKIVPFKTELKGWGIKSLQDLKPNTFLIEYVGEVIDLKEFKRRCEKYAQQNNEHFYFMSLKNDLFIDATRKGNISRYFNHSCDPNCETQKWTVNGELRIGLFTKRPVMPDEELTFDYQFQTVGKKQPKCYCGSEKCRGYLGISTSSSSGALDYIWEDDSSDELSGEDETDQTEDEEDDNESNHSEKSSNTSENDKKSKKTYHKDNKDFDLNRQIKSISALTNIESVLKLCQLMFRTENIESRLDILDILLDSKSDASLRLFMDYHGLKLLWGWMVDMNDVDDSINNLNCKLKILQVLSMLPIKNRTMLEECKLLSLVKNWSESKPKQTNYDFNLDCQPDCTLNEWISQFLLRIVDASVDLSEKKNSTENTQINELLDKIRIKARTLFDEWNNLKQAFKIPKKQQIEERKEHERELDSWEKKTQVEPSTTQSHQSYNPPSTSNRPINREKNFQFKRFQPIKNFKRPPPIDYRPPTSMLTKEQRRLLFEQKVKEEEEAAAARAAAEAQALVEAEAAKAKAQQIQTQMELKWIYDSQNSQWVQCYVAVNANYQLAPPQPVPPPQSVWQQQPLANSAVYPQQPDLSIQQHIGNINLSESHLNDLKKAVFYFIPDTSTSISDTNHDPTTNALSSNKPFTPLSPTINEKSIKSDLAHSSHPKGKKLSNNSLRLIAARLPPNWKCKRNQKGVIYYYNVKTKKSQWHFPRVSVKSGSSKTSVIKGRVSSKVDDQQSKSNTPADLVESSTGTASTNIESPAPKLPDDNCPVSSSTSSTSSTSSSGVNNVSNSSTSEIFKIYKDQFREKLSRLIVKLLQPYMKKECTVGHITNVNDFKHLARKFTHTILEKEISRTTKFEELDLDKRVKIKTQEFVANYMNKFVGNYVRPSNETNL